jgi:hypothetical protein
MVFQYVHLSVMYAFNGRCCYEVTVNCKCKCMSWSLNVRCTAVAGHCFHSCNAH